MSVNSLVRSIDSFEPDIREPIRESILSQYEKVIVESLITSFGLDFLVSDSHGGDVDTIKNVRQIGKDDRMTYKNKVYEEAYENRGEYNSTEYHSDKRYIEKNRSISEQKKAGTLKDAYTGKKIPVNAKSDLDHVISAKEIHDDRGRVLSGLSGVDLANSDENLQATNPRTNRTKKAKPMSEFLDNRGDEYTEKEKTNMRRKDAIARKAYEQKIAREYYTSPQFRKDVSLAAGKVGISMGARQALGFVFSEIWFCIKDEFKELEKVAFDIKNFFTAIGTGIKKGWEQAQIKFKDLFSRFLNGAIAGTLASVTTTLCNIFFTTAKNAVKIFRESWASLVRACEVLFKNPDGYLFGDRIRAVVKILATGASVIAGTIVTELVGSTGIKAIPVLGETIQVFCGVLVSGILSCTFLYFFDRSPLVQKIVDFLNNLPTLDKAISYYKEQAQYFHEYAAKLMKIDLAQFQKEVALYTGLVKNLESAKTEEQLNAELYNFAKKIGLKLSWEGYESFDSFMLDKNARMVFE